MFTNGQLIPVMTIRLDKQMSLQNPGDHRVAYTRKTFRLNVRGFT